MRGCWSSKVVDCSASCERSALRCSISRRMDSELAMSEELDRLAGADELAQLPRPRLQIGLLPARRRNLRIDLGELLIGQRGIVGADEQIGLGAIVLDLGFGVRHLGAQIGDLAGQPIAGGAGLILLRRLLHLEVGLRRSALATRAARSGSAELKSTRDHAGFFHRVDVEPVVIGFERALFFRHGGRIAADAEQAEHNSEHRRAAQRRIEFRIVGELFLVDHLARQIAREHELDLAGHRFGIDGGAVAAVLVGFGAQEHVLARLQQQPRFGAVTRGHGVDDGEGGGGRQQRDAEDLGLLGPQNAA